MVYNIVISTDKRFSTGPGAPLANAWVFNPLTPISLNYIIGSALPPPLVIDTFIRDYLKDPLIDTLIKADSIENVVIRAKNTLFNGNVVWAVLSGEIFAATPAQPISSTDKTGYNLLNDLNVSNILTFQNLSLLTEGIYSGRIEFTAYNISSSFIKPILIDTVYFNYKIIVTQQALIAVAPTVLNFTVLRNQLLPAAQTVTVTQDGFWSLTLDNKFTASAAGVVDNSTATQTVITGTGNKSVSIGVTSAFNTLSGNLFQGQAVFKNSAGASAVVQINVSIVDTTAFKVTPESLYFEAVKGFTEADAQTINIIGFGAFTIEAPTWLTLSAASGTNTSNIIVTPLSAVNLSANTYTGVVKIKTNSTEVSIPVTYYVQGSVSSNLQSSNFNFTKDVEFINIRNANRDAENVVKLTLDVIVYSYLTHKETALSYVYVLPFFNYATNFHVGEIIERLLKKPVGVTDFNIANLDPAITFAAVYKPATVNATIDIIKRSTSEVIVTESLKNLWFVAGKKPASFVSNGAILSNNTFAKRVTAASKELVNFLVPDGIFEIQLQKNKEAAQTMASINSEGQNIFQYYIDFSAFKAADVVTISVLSAGNVFKKTYQLLPEGDYSNHIAFINQYNVLELFEFTGDYFLQSDIKKITHKYYKNLTEYIETLGSTKDVKLFINSGDLFKTDQIIIDEIVRSKKAWLLFNNKPAIELIPVDKKLTNFDSDQELYDFEIEFDINRAHDAENYSF